MNIYQTRFVNHYVRPYLTDTPRKGYTLAGLSLLTIIVFGQFALRPAVTSVMQKKDTVAEGRVDSQKLTTKIAALQKARDNLTQYAPQISLLEDAKIGSGDSSKIITKLLTLTEKYQITFNFYQKETASGDSGTATSFWIGVSGDYGNLVNFLKNINALIPTASVAQVNLSKDKDSKIVQATVLIDVGKL